MILFQKNNFGIMSFRRFALFNVLELDVLALEFLSFNVFSLNLSGLGAKTWNYKTQKWQNFEGTNRQKQRNERTIKFLVERVFSERMNNLTFCPFDVVSLPTFCPIRRFAPFDVLRLDVLAFSVLSLNRSGLGNKIV